MHVTGPEVGLTRVRKARVVRVPRARVLRREAGELIVRVVGGVPRRTVVHRMKARPLRVGPAREHLAWISGVTRAAVLQVTER